MSQITIVHPTDQLQHELLKKAGEAFLDQLNHHALPNSCIRVTEAISPGDYRFERGEDADKNVTLTLVSGTY